MSRITVLGLGAMGSRMAARLVDAGHEVTVWNRSPGAAADLEARGARVADTPRAAATGAEAIVAMLRDDAASEQVWSDPEVGALAGTARGALAIESSTLTPDRVRAWARSVRAVGGRPIEAPVSGSRPQAAAGTLVHLLGGEADDIAAALPILRPMGQAFHAVGPIGSATVVKLVTNSLLAVQVGAWAELLPLMQRTGLDLDAALSALSTVSSWAPVAGHLTMLMRKGDHAPQFPIELLRKDMDYAAGIGTPGDLPLVEHLRARLDAAIAAGLGSKNMSALIELPR